MSSAAPPPAESPLTKTRSISALTYFVNESMIFETLEK